MQTMLETEQEAWKTLPEVLKVFINTDGVPLTKSTNHCFWPILCEIFNPYGQKYIFEVGIYHGKSKPDSFNEFLVSNAY